MIPQETFLQQAFETFDVMAIDGFRDYLANLPRVTKWIVASDYCLHEKAYPYAVFGFTLIPYDRDFETLKQEIRQSVRRDLKKTSNISEEVADFLKQPRFFHFAFRTSKDRQYFTNGQGSKPRQVVRESIKIMVDTIPWDGELKAKLKVLKQDAESNNFDFHLLSDQIITSLLFNFIGLLLARESAPEIIGWFSDRDDMTSFHDGLMFHFAEQGLHGLGQKFDIDTSAIQCMFGVPDRTAPEEMWFDDLIRLADYFAGTIAGWNTSQNFVSHPKYVQMLQQVVADQPNVVVLNFEMNEKGSRFGRLDISKTRRPTRFKFQGEWFTLKWGAIELHSDRLFRLSKSQRFAKVEKGKQRLYQMAAEQGWRSNRRLEREAMNLMAMLVSQRVERL